MVVEDSADTRNVISLTLQEQGYGVITARNGQEAVDIARKSCPDLILMDLNMPFMDGLTATEQIRGCEELCREVPILAITAYDAYGMKDAALEAGCNGYILKPLDLDRLNDIVGRVLYC
jgi:two-component system, cell cycle response regulator DivK